MSNDYFTTFTNLNEYLRQVFGTLPDAITYIPVQPEKRIVGLREPLREEAKENSRTAYDSHAVPSRLQDMHERNLKLNEENERLKIENETFRVENEKFYREYHRLQMENESFRRELNKLWVDNQDLRIEKERLMVESFWRRCKRFQRENERLESENQHFQTLVERMDEQMHLAECRERDLKVKLVSAESELVDEALSLAERARERAERWLQPDGGPLVKDL
ncbi:MAG: hypothetical protein M1831_001061 [Alyxoria varia]|nr:MAG: hypothetical protein M1831_001061 [Alyxoria varia]